MTAAVLAYAACAYFLFWTGIKYEPKLPEIPTIVIVRSVIYLTIGPMLLIGGLAVGYAIAFYKWRWEH